MADGDSYSWIGGTAGIWGNAANWEDLTTGTVAATAPDIDNAVSIGAGVTIEGTGSAASLIATNGQPGITIAAALNVGTLATGSVFALSGATIVGDEITLGQVNIDPAAPEFDILSAMSGSGTVEVLSGGTLNHFALDGATVTYQLDGNATFLALLDSIGGGNTIILDGTSNTIDIASTYDGDSNFFGSMTPQISAPIEGFGTTDQIDFQGITVTSATYNSGTLSLSDGTTAVENLTLVGDYSADTFEVNGNVVTVVPTASLPQSYSWIGGATGTWGNAANWEDLTTGTIAATAPGVEDTAIIGAGTILGAGTAASLVIQSAVSVAGNLNVDTLMVDADAGLTIDIGNTIIANTATVTGSLEGSLYASNQGELVVNGTLWLDSDVGQLAGYTQANSLVLNDASPQIIGTIELGNAGVAASPYSGVGEVAIDQGHTLSGTGGLFEYVYNTPDTPIYANGIVNGLVSSANLQIGEVVQGSYTIFEPGAPEYGFDFLGTSLNGTGTVEVLTGGTIYVAANVTGSGLTFQLDGSATLETAGTIATGNAITMEGSADTLLVNGGSMLASLVTGYDGVPFTLESYNPDDLPPVPPTTPFIGGTIYGFNPTDQIDIRGIAFDTASWSGGTLDLVQGGNVVDTLTLDGDYADSGFVVTGTTYAGQPEEIVSIACFAAGTRIATPRGEIPVESLRQGDEVTLASGGTAPIVWIGRRRIDCRSHPKPHDVWPVRIRHSAFAPGIPCRDLFLSPDHAVFAEEVLIPIKYLRNGETIQQAPCDTVEYFHLELPSHDLVLADGMAVESYLDTGDRSSFENAGRVITLFPEFSSLKWEAYGYAPLVVTGPPVEAARRRIEIQAQRQDSAPRRQRRRETS
jgi:cytoskeletal protein CcmA (bactofilin family)